MADGKERLEYDTPVYGVDDVSRWHLLVLYVLLYLKIAKISPFQWRNSIIQYSFGISQSAAKNLLA